MDIARESGYMHKSCQPEMSGKLSDFGHLQRWHASCMGCGAALGGAPPDISAPFRRRAFPPSGGGYHFSELKWTSPSSPWNTHPVMVVFHMERRAGIVQKESAEHPRRTFRIFPSGQIAWALTQNPTLSSLY